MTIPRSQQICLETTRYYNCTSRCVRRGFLCGYDKFTNTNYEHRRQWLERRIQQVASVYCIQTCSYAIMSNHYHVTVFVNKEQALKLTKHQVIDRWKQIHHLEPLMQKAYRKESLSKAEQRVVNETIQIWRSRLYAINWFMSEINLFIARKSNREDKCTGHFWEGRYGSQMVFDDKGLLASMVYIDLNPIRSKVAETPEDSSHTSIKTRLILKKRGANNPLFLQSFNDEVSNHEQPHIPFSFTDYLELVDWTGRQLRANKRGYIDNSLPPILERLRISKLDWLSVTQNLEKPRAIGVGAKHKLTNYSKKIGKTRCNGYPLPD